MKSFRESIDWFHSLQIRTKLLLTVTLLIGMISAFVFFYFPAMQKKNELLALSHKAESIARMSAYSLSPALYFDDLENIEDVINSTRQYEDISFILVYNEKKEYVAGYNTEIAGKINFDLNQGSPFLSQNKMLLCINSPVYQNEQRIGEIHLGISLNQLQVRLAQTRKTSAIVSLLIFLIGIFSISGIGILITGPLRRIAITAQQIAEGDLTKRTNVTHLDEVGYLARSFNSMVDKLLGAKKESENLNLNLAARTQDLELEISRNKKAKEDLKASEERFRNLFEFAPDPYYLCDPKGRFIDGNYAAEKIIGYHKEELIGKSFLKLKLLNRRQIPKAAKLLVKNALGHPTGPDEFILNRKDRTQVILEISTVPIQFGGKTLVLGIAHDITAHKKLEDELRIAKIEAEAASHAKSEFLASMSHELRTPLNAIMGFSQVLEEQYFGRINKKQREYIKDILDSGKHLLHMINDILDLSKIEISNVEINRSWVNIEGIIAKSMAMIKEKCMKNNIQLNVHLGEALKGTEIWADERRFKQVLLNLLTNAAKFTPQGGSIDLNIERNGKNLLVSVADSGIGIEKKHQKKIFEPFYQVKGGIKDKTSGTGLGLSLCKQLVEMHQGSIWVESKGKGKGSQFHFVLPLTESRRFSDAKK